MNKTDNFKDSMRIFGVIALLTYVLKLWPILLLVLIVVIACLAYTVFLDAQRKRQQAFSCDVGEYMDSVFEPIQAALTGKERALMDRFGKVQQGISEQLEVDFPHALWRWESSDPFSLMEADLPMRIVLKRAGGIVKATVIMKNGRFAGLEYCKPAEKLESISLNGDTSLKQAEAPAEVDYSLLAMSWVDNNYTFLQSQEENERPYIPADMLPDRESWADICKEMEGWGYEAKARRKGIAFKLLP